MTEDNEVLGNAKSTARLLSRESTQSTSRKRQCLASTVWSPKCKKSKETHEGRIGVWYEQ